MAKGSNPELCHLNKAVCEKCFVAHDRKWGIFEEMRWSGVMGINTHGRAMPSVCCTVARDEDGKYLAISAVGGIPTDCPYHVEHLMKAQNA